jgi:hypothetical protein
MMRVGATVLELELAGMMRVGATVLELELAGMRVGATAFEFDCSSAVSQEVSTGRRLLTSNLGGVPVKVVSNTPTTVAANPLDWPDPYPSTQVPQEPISRAR